MVFKISRPDRENKSKTVSFRMTDSGYTEIEDLRGNLKFKSNTDLLNFAILLFKKIYEWKVLGYKFYIKGPGNDFKEVEIEL